MNLRQLREVLPLLGGEAGRGAVSKDHDEQGGEERNGDDRDDHLDLGYASGTRDPVHETTFSRAEVPAPPSSSSG